MIHKNSFSLMNFVDNFDIISIIIKIINKINYQFIDDSHFFYFNMAFDPVLLSFLYDFWSWIDSELNYFVIFTLSRISFF